MEDRKGEERQEDSVHREGRREEANVNGEGRKGRRTTGDYSKDQVRARGIGGHGKGRRKETVCMEKGGEGEEREGTFSFSF